MSEITFQQEFMINPSATQSAELLANWQPVFKKTLFGKKAMPPPPALCSLFITSGHLKVDLMDGEHKIGEYTLEPNTAIMSVNLGGYVEAFALLNSVIHISPQKKNKNLWGVIIEMSIMQGNLLVVEEEIDSTRIESIIKRLENTTFTHVNVNRN